MLIQLSLLTGQTQFSLFINIPFDEIVCFQRFVNCPCYEILFLHSISLPFLVFFIVSFCSYSYFSIVYFIFCRLFRIIIVYDESFVYRGTQCNYMYVRCYIYIYCISHSFLKRQKFLVRNNITQYLIAQIYISIITVITNISVIQIYICATSTPHE